MLGPDPEILELPEDDVMLGLLLRGEAQLIYAADRLSAQLLSSRGVKPPLRIADCDVQRLPGVRIAPKKIEDQVEIGGMLAERLKPMFLDESWRDARRNPHLQDVSVDPLGHTPLGMIHLPHSLLPVLSAIGLHRDSCTDRSFQTTTVKSGERHVAWRTHDLTFMNLDMRIIKMKILSQPTLTDEAGEADTRRTAVVTGASRGIGRAIALGLAEIGTDLVLVARSSDLLVAVADEAKALGVDVLVASGDVTSPEFRQTLIAESWGWKGSIDFVVNAAGVAIRSEPPNVTENDWDRVFAVNASAPFFLSQSFGDRMVRHGGGAITNVGSVAARWVTRAPISYQASKAALVQATRGLAKALAPLVRVNAVGPGYVSTDLNSAWLSSPENRDYVLDRTPLGRIGQPSDVVGVVLFLCSEGASFLTGQHILVDGGWSVS